jgi:cell division protein FtsL
MSTFSSSSAKRIAKKKTTRERVLEIGHSEKLFCNVLIREVRDLHKKIITMTTFTTKLKEKITKLNSPSHLTNLKTLNLDFKPYALTS